MEKGKEHIDYDRKVKEYADQTGGDEKRYRGCGILVQYRVWPISWRLSSCRMVLNQDGSIQVQVAETEIGQGADTVFAQMAAETLVFHLKRSM